MAALIRIEGVTKRFGDVVAVDNLSLDINEGEFFALLGPSGCGKTTLLRMLAGFERPEQGRILLDGQDVVDVPPHRRPVNMMFQSYALFPHLSVESNVAFGLRQDSLAKGEIVARVRDMLALLKLDGLGARKPHQLSGGQRQRVALARALVKRPRAFLLDEPLAALDRRLREDTRFELMELQEQLKLAFIVVTHDQEEAMTVADRIAVMNRGRLEQVAPPSEVYEQPASRWVADFIGDVNLFEGRVAATTPNDTVIEAAGGGRMRVAQPIDAAPGTTVWVALRPEKIGLVRQPPADAGENCLAGRVHDIAYLGDTSVYKVRLDDGRDVKATAANRLRLIKRPIAFDERVWLTWPAEAAVVLTR
jgi:putrescine transport system ATP-binding protein